VENCITMVRKDEGILGETWKQRTEVHHVPTMFNDELAGGLSHSVPDPAEGLSRR